MGAELSGVRSLHVATIFRTEVRGDRGDVCGRRSGDTVGVTVAVNVFVGVNVLENVSAYVLVNVPGLWNVPAVLVSMSVQGSVADKDVTPRSGGNIRLEIGCEVDETDDADEPECLLVGEGDLEEYPVVEPETGTVRCRAANHGRRLAGRGGGWDLENADQPVLTRYGSVLVRRPSCLQKMR